MPGRVPTMMGFAEEVTHQFQYHRNLRGIAAKRYALGASSIDHLKTALARELVRFSHRIALLMLGKPEEEVCRDVSHFAGGLIELSWRVGFENRQFVLDILQEAVFHFDRGTFIHQKNVSRLANFLAQQLGISTRDRKNLILASRLHDIGKITLPIEIIRKPGPLGPEELDLKRLHLLVGLYFMEAVPYLREAADILRFNHFFDGYPEGLRFEEMDLPRQILSACDFYDALVTFRAYNGVTERSEALSLLAQRKYDDRIIETLAKYDRSPINP